MPKGARRDKKNTADGRKQLCAPWRAVAIPLTGPHAPRTSPSPSASIRTVRAHASNGLVELVDLVAEVISRLRIDDRDGGESRDPASSPRRWRMTGICAL